MVPGPGPGDFYFFAELPELLLRFFSFALLVLCFLVRSLFSLLFFAFDESIKLDFFRILCFLMDSTLLGSRKSLGKTYTPFSCLVFEATFSNFSCFIAYLAYLGCFLLILRASC